MTTEERNLINGLFDRLHTADGAAKDREAEQLIQQKVSAQPGAPYLMAQTVLVQEQALNNAQARIKDLETRLAEAAKTPSQESGSGGSFLSGLFGGGKHTPATPSQPPAPAPAAAPQQAAGSYAPAGGYAPSYPAAPAPAAGGGFLRTALAAAAGVAGGSLLYQGLENMLGNHAGGFGSSMGTGGNFMNTGFGGGGQPTEIIENREVVNNYYDNENRGGGNQAMGGGSGDAISNTDDGYGTPPHDDFTDNSNNSSNVDTADDGYGTPPTDDTTDSSSFDSGGDSGSFSDDSGSNDNLV